MTPHHHACSHRIQTRLAALLLAITATAAHAGDAPQAASPIAKLISANQKELEAMAKAADITPGADERLLAHQARFEHLSLQDITPSVTVRAGEYSVYSFIKTPDGLVAVDAGFFVDTTRAALLEYQSRNGTLPLKAVIYTHSHGDHTYGSEALLDPVTGSRGVDVYGPKGWQRNLEYEKSPLTPAVLRKAFAQMGALLPRGKDGSVGTALGGPITLGRSAEMLPVTKEITGQKETRTIGGIAFEFLNTPGDIAENMAVYLKQERVLFIGDILDGTFVPFQTARWEPGRTIKGYLESIEALQANFPDAEFLVAGHGVITSGAENIRRRLQNASDLAKYVDSYTDRAVLLGWSADQVVTSFQLPDRLANDAYLQGFYHRIDWILRGAYIMKNGPVSNINDLTRWPDAIEQPRLLALIGGRKRAMLEANKALRAGDPRWAGALANMVLKQHPGDVAARKLQKAALLKIAYTTMSANERNYALTDVLDLPWQTLLVTTMEAKIKHISTLNVLNQWNVRLHHADALTTRLELRVVVDDEPYLLTLREGVLDVVPATGAPGAASLAMSRSALDRIGAGALSLKDAIDTGLVSPSGDAAIARRLAELMM